MRQTASATPRDCALSTISVSRALCRPGVKVGIYIFIILVSIFEKKLESNELRHFDLLTKVAFSYNDDCSIITN